MDPRRQCRQSRAVASPTTERAPGPTPTQQRTVAGFFDAAVPASLGKVWRLAVVRDGCSEGGEGFVASQVSTTGALPRNRASQRSQFMRATQGFRFIHAIGSARESGTYILLTKCYQQQQQQQKQQQPRRQQLYQQKAQQELCSSASRAAATPPLLCTIISKWSTAKRTCTHYYCDLVDPDGALVQASVVMNLLFDELAAVKAGVAKPMRSATTPTARSHAPRETGILRLRVCSSLQHLFDYKEPRPQRHQHQQQREERCFTISANADIAPVTPMLLGVHTPFRASEAVFMAPRPQQTPSRSAPQEASGQAFVYEVVLGELRSSVARQVATRSKCRLQTQHALTTAKASNALSGLKAFAASTTPSDMKPTSSKLAASADQRMKRMALYQKQVMATPASRARDRSGMAFISRLEPQQAQRIAHDLARERPDLYHLWPRLIHSVTKAAKDHTIAAWEDASSFSKHLQRALGNFLSQDGDNGGTKESGVAACASRCFALLDDGLWPLKQLRPSPPSATASPASRAKSVKTGSLAPSSTTARQRAARARAAAMHVRHVLPLLDNTRALCADGEFSAATVAMGHVQGSIDKMVKLGIWQHVAGDDRERVEALLGDIKSRLATAGAPANTRRGDGDRMQKRPKVLHTSAESNSPASIPRVQPSPTHLPSSGNLRNALQSLSTLSVCSVLSLLVTVAPDAVFDLNALIAFYRANQPKPPEAPTPTPTSTPIPTPTSQTRRKHRVGVRRFASQDQVRLRLQNLSFIAAGALRHSTPISAHLGLSLSKNKLSALGKSSGAANPAAKNAFHATCLRAGLVLAMNALAAAHELMPSPDQNADSDAADPEHKNASPDAAFPGDIFNEYLVLLEERLAVLRKHGSWFAIKDHKALDHHLQSLKAHHLFSAALGRTNNSSSSHNTVSET